MDVHDTDAKDEGESDLVSRGCLKIPYHRDRKQEDEAVCCNIEHTDGVKACCTVGTVSTRNHGVPIEGNGGAKRPGTDSGVY